MHRTLGSPQRVSYSNYDFNNQPIIQNRNTAAITFAQTSYQNQPQMFTANSQDNSFRNIPTFMNYYSPAPIIVSNQQSQKFQGLKRAEISQPVSVKPQTYNTNSNYRLENIPVARESQFKSGWFGKGTKGIVFESHENNNSYCC